MRKIWVISTVGFYLFSYLYVAVYSGVDDVGLLGGLIYMLIMANMILSAIVFHPRNINILRQARFSFIFDIFIRFSFFLIIIVFRYIDVLWLYSIIICVFLIGETVIKLIISRKIEDEEPYELIRDQLGKIGKKVDNHQSFIISTLACMILYLLVFIVYYSICFSHEIERIHLAFLTIFFFFFCFLNSLRYQLKDIPVKGLYVEDAMMFLSIFISLGIFFVFSSVFSSESCLFPMLLISIILMVPFIEGFKNSDTMNK